MTIRGQARCRYTVFVSKITTDDAQVFAWIPLSIRGDEDSEEHSIISRLGAYTLRRSFTCSAYCRSTHRQRRFFPNLLGILECINLRRTLRPTPLEPHDSPIHRSSRRRLQHVSTQRQQWLLCRGRVVSARGAKEEVRRPACGRDDRGAFHQEEPVVLGDGACVT